MRALNRKLTARQSWQSFVIFLLLLLSTQAIGQLLSGFDLRDKNYAGPSVSLVAADPIWVSDYHTLILDYRAAGKIRDDFAVLTLRPGSVGPITPRANNPENPLASGEDVVVIRGRDLVTDGRPHTFELDVTRLMKTPQVDGLEFALPEGANLNVTQLEFRGDQALLPCATLLPPEMPRDSDPVAVHGPESCAGAAATTLRGRQSLTADVSGKKASTLYLDLFSYLAGYSNYVASNPQRPQETSETSYVIANVRYADKPSLVQQQFPMLVSEHRHALLNRQRTLYALQLDPGKRLLSVELEDRSPHMQLVLFRAALSNHPEASIDEPAVPTGSAQTSDACTIENTLGNSEWFKVAGKIGPPADAIESHLTTTDTPHGVDLGLTLTNTSEGDVSVDVSFPSLKIRVDTDASGVSYLFPQRVATISSRDADLSADYGPNFLMQFIDVFSEKAHCGVAVIVKDTRGISKAFALKKTGADVFEGAQYHIRISPHQAYVVPDVKVVLHNGDWHSGFEAYRQWLSSWYQPQTPRPAWLTRSFFMRRDYPTGGSGLLFDEAQNRYTFGRLVKEGQNFGGIDFIDISGWALSDTHGRVGDYPIELSTPADLRNNIQMAWSQHIPTGLYFEGYLIDKNSDIGKAHGAAWQLIGPDGKGLWWPHGSPEMFLCPDVTAWQDYLSNRVASVAKQLGAQAVYLDEYNCRSRQCFSDSHGHAVGANTISGEIETAKKVRRALDHQGMTKTILYTECPPVDIGTPYVNGSFTYALPSSAPSAYGVKLNLWRFAFPQVRLWDMVSSGVEPHLLSAEDFRFAFWHGDGVWLKGRADTWYGTDILDFLRWAHPLLLAHAAAFTGKADPLISSDDPHILINRFVGGGETVYTFFNNSYETRRFQFHGKQLVFDPRGVQLVAEKN